MAFWENIGHDKVMELIRFYKEYEHGKTKDVPVLQGTAPDKARVSQVQE